MRGITAFAVVVVASSTTMTAQGLIISKALDRAGVRTPLLGEGYLSYHDRSALPLFPLGEERTGWTDQRHPSRDTSSDSLKGYDYSDFSVRLATNQVRDTDGDLGVGNASPGRRRDDYDVTNAAYQSQAGISVHGVNDDAINGNDITTVGGSEEPKLSQLFGTNRHPDASVINAYYVNNIPNNRGYALPVTYAARGGFAFSGNTVGPIVAGAPVYNTGFAMGNNAVTDTFAHELGHVLLDTNRYTTGDTFHSSDNNDLLAGGGGRNFPTLTSKDGAGFGIRDAGLANGPLGTRSHFDEKVTDNTGTGAQLSTARALNNSAFVRHVDNGLTYGDRADFNWVEDSYALEAAGGLADNHAGADSLYYQKGIILTADESDKQKIGWGSLNLGGFAGDFFAFADVVSQVARYSDNDIDPDTNAWSARASALDYIVEFSFDSATWVQGTPVAVYVEGWTTASQADNYVARWLSPFDALYLRITADKTDGHDGNTQIDAVIVAIPEPGALVGVLGAVPLVARRRQREGA